MLVCGGQGKETPTIRDLFVNNHSSIIRHVWNDGNIDAEAVYSASEGYSIISFDVTDDGKKMILSEGKPFLHLGDRILDPKVDYYGIGSTNLVLADLENNESIVVDTFNGTYGEGARWLAEVGLSPNDRYFYALIGGWEWNSLYFFSFPDAIRLPDIPIIGDGVNPVCWSGNGNILYADYFTHGDPEANNNNIMYFDLLESQSGILEEPCDSIIPPDVLLSQGVGPTDSDRKIYQSIWSPDGQIIVRVVSENIVLEDCRSQEQKVLLEYNPVSIYEKMPAKNMIRVIWE